MNILIHAMMYPEGEKDKRANTSLFLHEYAVQWKKAGHDVRVIHHKMAYPAWMERCARLAAKLFASQKKSVLLGYKTVENCTVAVTLNVSCTVSDQPNISCDNKKDTCYKHHDFVNYS